MVSELNQQLLRHHVARKIRDLLFRHLRSGHRPAHLHQRRPPAAGADPRWRRHSAGRQRHSGGRVSRSPSTRKASCELRSGDLLVCYTDGITEPENEYGEMFGEERLIELVAKNADRDEAQIIESVMEAVRQWTGVPELSDDMTVLLARKR